jgi:lysyl-tRNA synthetase class II
VLTTEPRLTIDVFDYAKEHIWKPQRAELFRLHISRGELTVAASSLAKDQIYEYEKALSQAEKAVQQQHKAAAKPDQEFLNELCHASGLPLQ